MQSSCIFALSLQWNSIIYSIFTYQLSIFYDLLEMGHRFILIAFLYDQKYTCVREISDLSTQCNQTSLDANTYFAFFKIISVSILTTLKLFLWVHFDFLTLLSM